MTWQRRVAGWLVHFFTASGAVLGLLMLNAVHRQHYLLFFWLMAISIVIDAMDGTLARLARIKESAPGIDGALLDNLIDYLNYVVVPAFFLLQSGLLPAQWNFLGVSLIVLSSAYQFTQVDAKTEDHFFKGFPSYWNILAFYLFIWNMPSWMNMAIVIVLSALVFVPIKYVYPSRLTYLNGSRWLRSAMFLATIVWGIANFALLLLYPGTNRWLMAISTVYILLYGCVSVCATFRCIERLSSDA